MKIKDIAYNDDNHETIVTIDIEGTQDAAYYVLRTALAFFQNNDGLFYGVNIDHSAHEAIIIAYVGTPTEYSHEDSVNKVRKLFEKAIKGSAPTNTIPIDKAKSAICKACGWGECQTKCEAYSRFINILEGGDE